MTTRLPSRWRFLSMTVIGALFWSLSIMVSAQTSVINSGFTLDFLKSEEVASVDEVVSNVVKAVNRTSRPIRFTLDLASPAGWQIVNNLDKLHTIAAGDSTFIPVRLIPSKETKGSVNYFISATAYSEFGNALASTPWTLSIKKISDWKMNVSDREIIFPDDADSASFFVRLENRGNAMEKIRVTFTPDIKLRVMDANWEPFKDNTLPLSLPVGIDTTFEVNVKVISRKQKGYFFTDSPDAQIQQQGERRFRVQVQATSTTDKSKVSGKRVDFLKLTRSVKFDSEKGSGTIPLEVELNSFNLLSNFTNFSLDLRGRAELGKQQYLRYSYQALITNNVVTGTQFQTSNRFLQYTSPRLQVAAGNVGENVGILVNGQGVKAKANIGKFFVGGLYVGNANRPGRLAVNNLTFYGGHAGYRIAKNSSVEVQFVNRVDDFNVKEGDLYRLRFDARLSKKHRIGITGGYSVEEDSYDPDSVFQLSGYGAELRYGGRVGRMNVAVSGTYSSDQFMTQISGGYAGNASFRYSFGNRRYLTFRLGANEASPRRIVRGNVFQTDFRAQNFYELNYEWRTELGTFTFFPRMTTDELLGLRVETKGAGVSYASRTGRNMRLYSKFYSGFSELPTFPEVEPFLVARWENRLKYKNLNVLARYNYGPGSIVENFRVANDRINPQSFFFSAYANMYFRKVGLEVKPRINSSYESSLARWRTTLAQSISYFAKTGYIFTIGTDLLLINQGENPIAQQNNQLSPDGIQNTFRQSNFFLRVGVKKQFGFKRPGSRNFDMKVAVFKDQDGNGIRDKGEEYVRNVLIKVRGKSAITGEDGTAVFSNLAIGNYIVESDVLDDTQGWFKSDNTPVLLEKDKTVFIPLTKGVQISGMVVAQKATYSAFANGVKLGGVRITAVGADDRTFSALTDREGRFSLFVPFGDYEIKASSAGIDSQLQFAQDSYPIKVNSADSNYQLTFYLIEKNRRLNIKRFNNN